MTPLGLLNWMLLSTALLGAWWLCYRLALRQERGFAYNRWFLVLGPVLAGGLPLLPLAWPATWGAGSAGLPGLPDAVAVLLPAVTVTAGGAAETSAAVWPLWLAAGYVGGTALRLGQLGLALGRLWRRARRLPREKGPDYVLVRTHGQLPTSSFGRAVFWDETLLLSPAEAAQVLRHELAHVRQGHTFDRLLLEVLGAVLWFNPFVHLCGRALALTHEFLADEAALRHDSPVPFSEARSYAHLLARQVAGRLGFSVPLAHSFSHSQTLTRIAMIQKTSPVCRWKQWLVLPLLGSLVVAVACEKAVAQAGTQQVAPPPPPIPIPMPVMPMPGGNQPAGADKLYTYVEQMPQLPGGGGNAAIVGYIQSHLAYPKVAPVNRKEGRVFVSFTVAKTGAVQAIKIVKGLAAAYDAAVVAAVQQLPHFTPGRQSGVPVNVSFTVPIQFATAPLPDGQPGKTTGH